MATFPLLNSGAVAQHPLSMRIEQAADVIRFIDGSEQRFRTRGRMLRQWQIRLELLTEDETAALDAFFAAQFGECETFVFPDPFSNTDIPNCRVGDGSLTLGYAGLGEGATSLWVVETLG